MASRDDEPPPARRPLAWLERRTSSVSAWNSLRRLGRRPAFPLARNNLDAAQRQLDLKKAEQARQQAPAGR